MIPLWRPSGSIFHSIAEATHGLRAPRQGEAREKDVHKLRSQGPVIPPVRRRYPFLEANDFRHGLLA